MQALMNDRRIEFPPGTTFTFNQAHFVTFGTINASHIRRPEPKTWDEAFQRAYAELNIESGLGVHGQLERSMARMGWDYNSRGERLNPKVNWAKEGF